MALPSRYGIDKKINSMEGLSAYENGGKGSGNFGHLGRPGLVGGSGGGVGKFLFDGDLPSKNPKPTKEGYVVVHHNTDNETADAIAKEGLVAGKNLGAYQVSPEEGLGIWTDSRAKTDSSYGGCTVSFQIPKEEYEKYAVNDTQHLIPRNIAREDIVCIDKIINENGSNGKPIKVSNLKDNVDYYTKKGLDEKKVISIIAKNSHGIITEQEIKELVDFKKKVANGGPGSGNFGHSGRPGEVGGSASGGSGYVPKHKKDMRIRDAIIKSITGQKELQDRAKVVQEDIEDRIGQKVKEGEEYTALDEALKERFKYFHGEDGTEYTYDKGNGMITRTNPKTGDQEVVTKQKKDYSSERRGVSARDGSGIGNEFADLSAELETARTNLKVLKEDKGKAYKDLAGRRRFLDRSSDIGRSLHYAEALRKSKLSKETKKLVKEMESELKLIRDEYDKLGTEKYFDPDLNHEN